MADGTKIEWTDATWQVITGCSVVGPGCKHCYAMKLAGTRLKHHPSRAGLTIDTKTGPVWNGEVRFNEQWLDLPLRWKRPRKIFVVAHGDLFHENVPDEWIDRVFAVMARCQQHTFQVLTKRSARMRDYLTADDRDALIGVALANMLDRCVEREDFLPLPNVHIGVSCEDQKRADERIPDLLATPAVVRWVSAEPLLGPINFRPWLPHAYVYPGEENPGDPCQICGKWTNVLHRPFAKGKLHGIVVGGESGKGARPMHPDWARRIRDDCAAAGVAFEFKQWGEFERVSYYANVSDLPRDKAEVVVEHGGPRVSPIGATEPTDYVMRRVGKKRAGRLLDGVEHNAWPSVAGAEAHAA